MTLPKEDIEATRNRILEAAGERFRQFGFGKTTMVEIAGDCHMSAANLYRYFENKQDIGGAMAIQCLAQKTEILMQVVTDESRTASEKIESYFVETLRYNHEQWADQPRLNELVDVICQTRSDLVEDYIRASRSMLEAIVKEGVESGQFESCDTEEAADALKAAAFMFDYPNAMHVCPMPLEEFELKARRVARLVLKGLVKH